MGEQEMETEGTATGVRCAACGAIPAPATASAPSGAEGADTTDETHCEWCGAEYPVPGAT